MNYKEETIKVIEKRIKDLESDLKNYLRISKINDKLKRPEYRIEGDKLILKIIQNVSKEISDLVKFIEELTEEKKEND